MTHLKRNTPETMVRNVIFGVEDSLVSTVGLLSGVATAGVEKNTIILAGVILIFVEAFSMAAGAMLSENSVEEFETHREIPLRYSIAGAVAMFASYFVSGFVPLLPYLLWPADKAFSASIIASMVGLAVLGALSGRLFKVSLAHTALKMVIIGGLAVTIGVVAGLLLQ